MKLQDRDYSIYLNEEEKRAYEAEAAYAALKGPKSTRGFPRFSHPDKDIREFIWHKRSLFPNNYLHLAEYKNEFDFEIEAEKFNDIIYNCKNELEIQQYIKQNKKWFIPGSIFVDYNFGHHDAYLFPEQELGNEFEKANTEYLLQTRNTESESVRKGLTQIQDWKRWMDKNRDYFLRNVGLLQQGIDILVYRIYYYLVVSRRDFMTPIALEVRSQSMYEMKNTKIVTFDRLVDNIRKLEKNHSW